MKQDWTDLLWELWGALAVCAAAAMVPGSRFTGSPLRRVWGSSRAAAMMRSRRGVRCSLLRAMAAGSQASSMARPSPTMEATFSVPARWPRSWPPPSSRLGMAIPRRR